MEEIKKRCLEPGWPQLLIFPEGTNTNGEALVLFRSGAFSTGKPVQPVSVRTPNMVDTVTWTWDQPHGALSCILLTLTQWSTKVSLHYLPPYLPSQEEKDNPQLFADNVRQVDRENLFEIL